MVKDKNYNKFKNVQADPNEVCVDPLYRTFLESVEEDGNSYVFEMKNGDHGFPAFVKYEKGDECKPFMGKGDKSNFPEHKPSRATRYEAKKEKLAASTRPSTKAAHNPQHRKIYRKDYESDDFKRKLMIVLNKPYNHNEYQILLREAAERKPLCKVKNLRSITISYATEQLANSYLDYYPDLAKQIESANSEKALILLRGFFFWLKNLCHEGAYRPWSHHS